MARPERKNVDYFPHPVRNGKKMFVIKKKFKNDGYAVWYQLLEELGEANDHHLDFNDEDTVIYLASKFDVSEDLLFEIVMELVRLKEINQQLWNDYKVVFNGQFIDSIQDAYSKRKNKCITLEGLREVYPVKAPVNPVKGAGNTQSKVKERKVKESIEKYTLAFENFWNIYPKRKGKKIGKKESREKFFKQKETDLEHIIKNAENYGINNNFPKDPERFLSKEFWKQWDEPQTAEPQKEVTYGYGKSEYE